MTHMVFPLLFSDSHTKQGIHTQCAYSSSGKLMLSMICDQYCKRIHYCILRFLYQIYEHLFLIETLN